MLRSRVVLGLIVLASTLAISGAANADEGVMMEPSYGMPSPYMDLYYLPAKAAYANCHKVGARYRHGVLVSHRHWSCGMYSVRWVCSKTVSTITPIHRDTYCSEYTMVRGPHHGWGRVYLYR